MRTIDIDQYDGECRCGHKHELSTKLVIIQSNCMRQFEKYMAQVGLTGHFTAVYDENTYLAKGLTRPEVQQEIILAPENLHADEMATAKVLEQLSIDTDVLIAIGSGTIHDIVRYCANEREIPFVACPTAASVDGFCSTISAMTWHGFKKTLPGVAPTIVLADTEVIRQAPLYLALSGVGDILGKYTALLDWNISNLLTGEFLCREIEDITLQAVKAVHDSCQKVVKQDAEAFEQLIYGLLLSGIAMQMMGNSRPASGAEHHISHFIEMQPAGLPIHNAAMHGEKVGVATLLVSDYYHKLENIENIAPYLSEYQFPTDQIIKDIYGPALAPSIFSENANDCMNGVTQEKIKECWQDIRKMIEGLPTKDKLDSLYKDIGAKRTLEDIGLDSSLLPQLFEYSPFVRNRLTFMRVTRSFKSIDV